MGVHIKPSDLWYKYGRKKDLRPDPVIPCQADPHPFDPNNLYEIIPMFEAVMDSLETNDGHVLRELEEVLNRGLPSFISSREKAYDFLMGTMHEVLREDG